MTDTREADKYAVYFSHSWRPHDVELNLSVCEEIAQSSELLVDVPEEPGADPPYYINRIEELLRRSDLFLCVLAERDSATGEGPGDASIRYSPYSLFEIRLAERLNIPRFVLYERGTRFRSPPRSGLREVYIPFDRGVDDPLPERRNWRTFIAPNIRQWVEWAVEHLRPMSYEPSNMALSLISRDRPESSQLGDLLQTVLGNAGYERVLSGDVNLSNTEVFRILHSTGLVIADLSREDLVSRQICALAHGLGVPTIRMISGDSELPWLLQGHPGGYQHDIVRWNNRIELRELIEPRANAMFRISPALAGEEARRYLQSKRYSKCFVFISHTLKPPHRALVENIVESLRQQGVNLYEYHTVNVSGAQWKRELNEQLSKTTHFVVLLTEGYETSENCIDEMDEILRRGNKVKILPFMANGRSAPHPKLKGRLHHRLLSAQDPRSDADVVVKEVIEVLAAN